MAPKMQGTLQIFHPSPDFFTRLTTCSTKVGMFGRRNRTERWLSGRKGEWMSGSPRFHLFFDPLFLFILTWLSPFFLLRRSFFSRLQQKILSPSSSPSFLFRSDSVFPSCGPIFSEKILIRLAALKLKWAWIQEKGMERWNGGPTSHSTFIIFSCAIQITSHMLHGPSVRTAHPYMSRHII